MFSNGKATAPSPLRTKIPTANNGNILFSFIPPQLTAVDATMQYVYLKSPIVMLISFLPAIIYYFKINDFVN